MTFTFLFLSLLLYDSYLDTFERIHSTPILSPLCGNQETKDEIFRDVIQWLVRNYGAKPFGRVRIYSAASCLEVHQAYPMLRSGEYWISNDAEEAMKMSCYF